MHLAASVGAVSLIELMILNGASAKIRDFDGRLPLHWATTPKTTKSIALLMKVCVHVIYVHICQFSDFFIAIFVL